MCGRFVASRPVEEIVEQFDVDDVRLPEELLPGPRFNIAPQDEVFAIRDAPRKQDRPADPPATERRLSIYRWGLVPSWAKDPSVGARAFNARAESLEEKSMFRVALLKRRCIVPADAFYEWQRIGEGTGRKTRRQPWCFRAAGGQMLGFAGLYELWRDRTPAETPDGATGARDGEWLRSCTIITTEANEMMAPVHDRMPVVLRPEEYGQWLAPGPLAPEELHDLLAPPPEDFLLAYEVGPEVGNSRAEGPQLAEPLEPTPSGLPALSETSP